MITDFYLDKKSAMILEMNGKGSSGKHTQDINSGYFFIKDRVDNKEVDTILSHMTRLTIFLPNHSKGKLLSKYHHEL
jgi:hypothetical protein